LNEINDSPRLKLLRVLVTGDSCWDYYHYGAVTRLSPEAPVPVFKHSYTAKQEGMAANVNNNIRQLCNNKNSNHIFASRFVENKNRYIDIKFKQQLFRVDEVVDNRETQDVIDIAEKTIINSNINLVIISDYDKGTLSYEQIEHIIAISKERNVPVFLDTKKRDLVRFTGAFVKINESEYNARISDCPNTIVTRAENGVIFYPTMPETTRYFPVAPIEFIDVTGAGDTFLAAVAFMYHITQDIGKSIIFANMAASVTIQHRGCYSPKLEEILNE